MSIYDQLPLKAALDRYIEHGCPVGHFLTAVLSNDLREACGRADLPSRGLLWLYVQYLYNEAPAICWGSPAKVKEWYAAKLAETEPRDES